MLKTYKNHFQYMTLNFGAMLVSGQVYAEPVDETWQVDAKLYLFGTSISGTVGMGPVDTDLDVSFGDILDNFDGGLMAGFEARKNDWMIIAGGSFLQVSDTGTLGSNGPLSATLDTILCQTIAEGFVGYRLIERGAGGKNRTRIRVDSLAGLRYNNVRREVERRSRLFWPYNSWGS